MRDSNLVVRLTETEKQMVDRLQEKYAINVSQYVRNKLTDLDGIMSGGTKHNMAYLPVHLENGTRDILKKLREEFNCDPTAILSDAMDDDSIKEIISSNVLAIYNTHKDKERLP